MSTHQRIKQEVSGTKTVAKKKDEKGSDVSKEIKSNVKVSKIKEMKKTGEQKVGKKQPGYQKKPKISDNGGKIAENDFDRGKKNVKPLEPWSLGPVHNKIHINKHHAGNTEQ